MGANLRTFAVRHKEPVDVRGTLLAWLNAKGFGLSAKPRLFAADPQRERSLVLSTCDDWTIVAYSHAMEEGDRLVFELKKLGCPVLEIWVYDSDIWGYRLHASGNLMASFNSNPRYFGGPPELELPENGDPHLLCEVCELAVDAGQLQAIQWRRAVFSESVAQRFCREIGAETAAWDFRDFDEVALEPGEPISAGGFRIERLDFERHGERSAPRAVRLHDVVLRTQAVEPVDPEMLQWQAQLQRQMLPLTIAVRIIALPFRLVGWLIGPLFALWWRWKGRQHVRSGDLLSELLDRDSKLRVERQGSQLVNHVHGCRITVPDTASFLPSATREWVFSFQLEDAGIQCQAIRPSQLNEQLRAWPGAEIVQDEKITVDGRQARIVQLRGQAGNRSWCVAWYLIETDQAIYRFQVGGAELSAEVLASMRAILDSFRIDAATVP